MAYPKVDAFHKSMLKAGEIRSCIEDLNRLIAEGRSEGIIVFMDVVRAGEGDGLGIQGINARIAGGYAEIAPGRFTPK